MCVSPQVVKYSKANKSCISPAPCGHCYECVRKRKLDWEMRLTIESSAWKNVFFGMLTYADDFYHPDVQHEELQYFIKRLRYNLDKFYPGASLKYFLVSELGELKDRLHYHVLYFVSKEFDDTFREFQVLVELSWVKKVPLSEEDIEFRRNLYKKNKKRLNDERRKELFNWSRRKYDDIPIGFASAQNLKHGTAVGSIHYACKYIQKQYNKMFHSRLGFDVWRNYMIENEQLLPMWKVSYNDDPDLIHHRHLYKYVGDEYPTFPIRGKSYPVPASWMKSCVGNYYTALLRKKMADRLFVEKGIKLVDVNRQQFFEHKERERMLYLDQHHRNTLLSRRHNYDCRNDFIMTDLEWETSMTQKPSSPCPVEVESTFPIEIPLPLKWLS